MTEASSNEKYVWPDRLMIRDTTLHDDLGGLGQRIYTTAGAGYEKREYVRADILKDRTDRVIGEFAKNLRRCMERDDIAFICDEVRSALKETP